MIKAIWQLTIFYLLIYSMIVSVAIGAKRDKINIVITVPEISDQNLSKELNIHKKILEKETAVKLAANGKSYLKSAGRAYLLRLLQSLGYYSSTVECKDNKRASQQDMIFNIVPGPLYKISAINIVVSQDSYTHQAQLRLPPQELLGLQQQDAAIAKSILRAEKRLQDYIEHNNCLLSVLVNHGATVNKQDYTVEVIYDIKAGKLAYIDHVTFKGLSTVNEQYVRKLVPLKDGECFKIPKVSKAKGVLHRSGLFTLVEAIPIAVPDKGDKMVELQFRLTERQHRSIKTGINYSTDLGPGITASWEHRNLFAHGEKIISTLSVTKKEQELDNKFEKPFFLSDAQTLKLGSSIVKKNTPAYFDKKVAVSAALERQLTTSLLGGVGVKYAVNKIQATKKVVKNFPLLSTPIYGVYDSRDNILNATKGIYAKLEFSPYLNTKCRSKTFNKQVIYAATYLSAPSIPNPILAVRGAYGVISGIKFTDIPVTERFYAGGDGSIRGYGYQLVGDLNEKNEPIGGRSFVEIATELRLLVSKHLGGVIFIDGGNVFNTKYGKINRKNLTLGAGFGIRYYTDFAPLRVDIAFPVTKKRHKIDKAWQLYFNIGQAF